MAHLPRAQYSGELKAGPREVDIPVRVDSHSKSSLDEESSVSAMGLRLHLAVVPAQYCGGRGGYGVHDLFLLVTSALLSQRRLAVMQSRQSLLVAFIGACCKPQALTRSCSSKRLSQALSSNFWFNWR